jgi:hypothetical protein
MFVNGFNFHAEPLPPSSGEMAQAWRPYVDACIESFGANRCMFESNFPVDKGACSYPVLAGKESAAPNIWRTAR